MAIKRDKSKRQSVPIDPALETHIGSSSEEGQGSDPIYGDIARRRARMRNMTPYQRRKAQRDAERVKATYDLPESIKKQVDQVAKQHGVPKSHVVALGLVRLMKDIETGEIDLELYKVTSKNVRFEWFLTLVPPDQEEEL